MRAVSPLNLKNISGRIFFVSIAAVFLTCALRELIIGQKAELVVETSHGGAIGCLAVSPDGILLASGSADKSVKLWDRRTGRMIKSLFSTTPATDPASGIDAVEFSSDGSKIAFAYGPSVELWSVRTGRLLGVMQVSADAKATASTVAFSPGTKVLVTGSTEGDIRLWDTETQKVLAEMERQKSSVAKFSFAADGRQLFAGNADGTVAIWRFENDRPITVRNGSIQGHGNLSVSPDGLLVADASDSAIDIWNTVTGAKVKSLTIEKLRPFRVAFSLDGRTLAGIMYDPTDMEKRSLSVWSTDDWTVSRSVSDVRNTSYAMVFSPDGKELIFGGEDALPTERSVQTGNVVRRYGGSGSAVNAVAFSPDGRTLAAVAGNGSATLWDLTGRASSVALIGHTEAIYSIAFSPDGKTVATGALDGVKIWDVITGRELYAIKDATLTLSVAFSSDGKRIVTAGQRFFVEVWDATTGTKLNALRVGPQLNYSAAISPDGKTLAAAGFFKIATFDTESGRELQKFVTGEKTVMGTKVAFLADGQTLATSSWDRTVRLWESRSGKLLKTFRAHTGAVNSLAISNDGSQLFSASSDHSIMRWSLETGITDKTYLGHDADVTSVTVSPDSRSLAGGSADGSIRIWSTDGTPIVSIVPVAPPQWVVRDDEGRFDTNMPLDNVSGLHWIISDEILNPLPLDVFMRQYYEPNLLARLLKCNSEKEPDGTDTCDKEFKPLPSISAINRLQPRVKMRRFKEVSFHH